MFSGNNITCLGIAFCLALLPCCANSQAKDTIKTGLPKKNKNIFQYLMNTVKRSRSDSSMQADVLNSNNEALFLPYQGRGIRDILIKQFGFEKTFADTSKEIDYWGKKFVKSLHRNTKGWVIRNNLFIKKKTVLNANLAADNERYLRSLEYINDARILVDTIANEPDSIDLLVITRDFLSINAQLSDATTDRFKAKISNVNIMGMGQKVQFTALIEKARDPDFGFELLYAKSNIANTFINATAGYTNINPDLTGYTGDEHAWYAKLERPLVSQYLHMAGALIVGQNQTYNHYTKPDSLFYQYAYNTFDTWIGYNLGIHKSPFNKNLKNRHFISLRYFQNKFTHTPYQVDDSYNFRFNDRQAILAQFTFFRQNFYKTNYLFGFGLTEDVPYGYNIALTAGWYKQLHLQRPYVGADANRYIVTNKGHVVQYFLRTGTFLDSGQLQDAAILIGISTFSRVFSYPNLKIRQYMRLSYTRLFNRVGLDPIGINNAFGLRYFSLDSTGGDQRISLHTETFFFLKYKLLGFKFAPFLFGDVALLTPENESFSKSGFYWGLGGGIRMRNENLVFGTIELRFIYFPRKSQNTGFKLTVNTNLRFRYNSTYVKAPDIIQLNSDLNNNIF
jgi:hypothetical protein